MNFERGKDPLSSLGVGKRKLIEDWLDDHSVFNYTVNDDYTIDLNGSANLNGVHELPDYIRFNRVEGMFFHEPELVSCEGYPKRIYNNPLLINLNSLKGCPTKIGGNLK
jgi:hypothetical protein